MRSQWPPHCLVLPDDHRAVRIAQPACEDQPCEQVRCGLRKRVPRIVGEFSGFLIVGDDRLTDLHCERDGRQLPFAESFAAFQQSDGLQVCYITRVGREATQSLLLRQPADKFNFSRGVSFARLDQALVPHEVCDAELAPGFLGHPI